MSVKTVNIALDEKLLKQIDKAVKKDMASRSEYFRRLALSDLERRQRWTQLLDATNQIGHDLGIVSEDQVYQSIGEYKREKRQA